jgi:acetyl esterase/lipase
MRTTWIAISFFFAVMRPDVPVEVSPLQYIEVTASDGVKSFAIVRRPPGEGPFPAVLLIHGGLVMQERETLERDAKDGITHERFLAAGYVTVTPTHRDRSLDPQAPAWRDSVAMVEHVKKLPFVDPDSVVALGGSGGGSLCLEIAGEADLAAVAAGEPASVLFTGMMHVSDKNPAGHRYSGSRDIEREMAEPRKFYTPELQKFTREKIARIRTPIFIAQGTVHPIGKINREIIIPELEAAGKQVEVKEYPGQPHGFYFGRTPRQEAALEFFNDCDRFFQKHIKVQPKRIAADKVDQVPAKSGRGETN